MAGNDREFSVSFSARGDRSPPAYRRREESASHPSAADCGQLRLATRATPNTRVVDSMPPMVCIRAHLPFHSLLEERQHRRLFRRQPRERLPQFRFRALLQGCDQRTIHVGVDDRRMDVALAADRLGVSQSLRHSFDGFRDVSFGGGLRIEVFELLQGLSGQGGAGPRSKILGCKVLAADLPQVFVDVGRPDVMNRTLIVDVLEQLLTGKVLTLARRSSRAGDLECRSRDRFRSCR